MLKIVLTINADWRRLGREIELMQLVSWLTEMEVEVPIQKLAEMKALLCVWKRCQYIF